MKALVKTKPGIGNVEIRDVVVPKTGDDQILIEVKAVGLCGTDIHIYYDEYKSNPPVTLGHEVAGIITEKGKNVKNFEIGSRVTTETYFQTCGECSMCRGGKPNLCPERMSIGSMVNGGMAKYIVVPAANVHALPANIDFVAGSLTEPLACVVHSVLDKTKVMPGDVAVVSGPGPIGLLASQVIKESGAYTVVIGVESDLKRLRLAEELGADQTIVANEKDPQEIINELTNGQGADVVCECAGIEASVQTCLKLVRRAGQYTQIGLAGRTVNFDIDQVIFKEICIRGGFASIPSSWTRALKLMEQGKVKTDPLVSHSMPITEWKKAFDLFKEKSGLKIVLTPAD
ncbi:MAG: zinc-binding dehydrogenase [Desulfobacterales bacterium]|nr:MAG: zinc-binding dehydrogenase [Desulfobacterales bacterium]